MHRISFICGLFCLSLLNVYAQDQGVTSPTHGDYNGQIVFAKSLDAIAFKKERPGSFANSFKASESIYARLYLPKSVGNTDHGGNRAYAIIQMYDLYIDGQQVPFKKGFGFYKQVPENERTYYMVSVDEQDKINVWTTWRPTLLPDESDDELKYGGVNVMARAFALALLDQSPGTHEVELRFHSRDLAGEGATKVLASGKFTLELTASDKRELAFKYAPPLPKDEWTGGNKAQLIAEATAAFANQLNKDPIAVGLVGRDWQEGSYTLTGQKYRKLAAWAVFDDTDGDGQVPITTFNWISDYSNGGWTKMRFDSHCLGCPDWDVEVAAVKALDGN
ncbi:hypothetical protein CEQ90_05890 [Lewinellaceae bacterium SD302]|nr:hypothetical protein CEQ90_05890 [Lewinellaceae bacterium SD302]